MSKKHYVAIADTFRPIVETLKAGKIRSDVASSDWNVYSGEIKVLELLARELSEAFAADNPKFDRARFLKSCGF